MFKPACTTPRMMEDRAEKALRSRLITNWAATEVGQPVEVRTSDRPLTKAEVDDRSEDGRLLWVTARPTGVRSLLVRGDNVALYRLP